MNKAIGDQAAIETEKKSPLFEQIRTPATIKHHRKSSKERELQHFHLRVRTELTDLQDVLQWFETVIFPSLPQKTGWQCEVALVEAFTNAVRHAHYNLPKTTPIDLEVTLFASFVEMRIWDRGQPFDLKAKLQANSDSSTYPLEKEGGRGLQFMERLMDELRYLNLPNRRNCLLMRKKYTAQKNPQNTLDFRKKALTSLTIEGNQHSGDTNMAGDRHINQYGKGDNIAGDQVMGDKVMGDKGIKSRNMSILGNAQVNASSAGAFNQGDNQGTIANKINKNTFQKLKESKNIKSLGILASLATIIALFFNGIFNTEVRQWFDNLFDKDIPSTSQPKEP